MYLTLANGLGTPQNGDEMSHKDGVARQVAARKWATAVLRGDLGTPPESVTNIFTLEYNIEDILG